MFASGKTAAVASAANYIEDVFSTYLYTGNAGTQTVTNGIDLSTKGGMVWIKSRSGAYSHSILDTVRGFNYSSTQTKRLDPSTTDSQADAAGNATQASPLSDGFSVTTSGGGAINFYNASGATYASWTFRKQAKFFDVVTYTGNETAGKTVNHSLGSDPGCIIIKRISPSGYNWFVYHRSNPTKYTNLNLTNAETNFTIVTSVSSTNFTLPADASTNANGIDYVAYLFAHNAGGFGLTGSDNVISCGSYTGTGSVGPSVSLGYEPQWLLIKRATGTSAISGWYLLDNMRGIPLSGGSNYLRAETTDAETNNTYAYATPTATGFNVDPGGVGLTGVNYSGETYIYIAIRRGPMKVPTSGTSVFSPVTFSFDSFTTAGFPVDFLLSKQYNDVNGWRALDRLRGTTPPSLFTNSTSAESAEDLWRLDNSTGVNNVAGGTINGYENWMFRRAPSFFDEVCYTGTGSATTFSHNLGVAPEMMIVKGRTNTFSWFVYQKDLTSANESYLTLNTDSSATSGSAVWNSTSPTSSVFSVGSANAINQSGNTYVAYLFATCAGVSKVGSYTGTGTTKQVDCGFTGGARFVLIKRTDSTGDWYVWDSARGIVSGNDPYLLLNSTAAEVTNTDYIDTYSAGFEISSTAPAAINANGGTFIFLAIA